MSVVKKYILYLILCVVFNDKNMHAFDKQTRKSLGAVTLSRLLPSLLHFCNFITSHILLSSIVLHLLTSPSHILPILLPSSCFSMHSTIQLHTSELHIIENKADMRLLPYSLRPILTLMKKKRMKNMTTIKMAPSFNFKYFWHAWEPLKAHNTNLSSKHFFHFQWFYIHH